MTGLAHANAPAVLEHSGAGADGDQYTDSTAIILSVGSILIADRYRKDIGDVSDLAQSIVNVGLLNPITVTEYHGGYKLLAGERRLTAFKSLGLAEIPARVARDIADARDLLVAERDENTQRKPMLLSEATALGIAIQEMEAPAAAERRASTLRHGNAPVVFPGTQRELESDKWGHKTRDIAAEAVGMSPAAFVSDVAGSTRAIAPIVGASEKTVRNDISAGAEKYAPEPSGFHAPGEQIEPTTGEGANALPSGPLGKANLPTVLLPAPQPLCGEHGSTPPDGVSSTYVTAYGVGIPDITSWRHFQGCQQCLRPALARVSNATCPQPAFQMRPSRSDAATTGI